VNDSAAPREARTLLVVDDDVAFRTRLVRALRDRGFDARAVGSYDEAIAVAERESPELALIDLKLPGKSGLEVVRALKELDDATRIVVLTGYGSIATALESMRLGAANYLTKPVDADQVAAAFADEPVVPGAGSLHAAPTLARVEWEHIQRVLADCDGNVSQAARVLGLHRRSLQRKLSKMPGPETAWP
jgi:two-component system response regulator RegA